MREKRILSDAQIAEVLDPMAMTGQRPAVVMRRAALVLGAWMLPLALLAAARASRRRRRRTAPDGWRLFQGSWSAVGSRHTLPTEAGRTAAVVQLSGAVVLTDPTGAGRRAFRARRSASTTAEASAPAGRCGPTRAAIVCSARSRGDSLQTGRRIAGTITGGTGRYAGVTGEYTLTWQYVVAAEDGVVQGRTVDLSGRFRLDEKQP